jgi:hypothetical protein
LSSFLADLTTIATSVLGFVGNVTAEIVGDPFLLFTVGILFLGAVIGIVGRLLSRG